MEHFFFFDFFFFEFFFFEFFFFEFFFFDFFLICPLLMVYFPFSLFLNHQ